MKINSNVEYLFYKYLKLTNIDVVVDIGSMDGKNSLYFRNILPHASLYAFEANPDNYNIMLKNDFLRVNGVKCENMGISNKTSSKIFYCTKSNYPDGSINRGTSSFLKHPSLKIEKEVEVKTIRLDEYFKEINEDRNIALWIDVEGLAFEVLQGIEKLRKNVKIVHVELEKDYVRDG